MAETQELETFCEKLNAHDAKHAKRYQVDAFGRAWKRRDDGAWEKIEAEKDIPLAIF